MNAAAFILALAGAGLSLFQPVIPLMGISFWDFLSSPNSDLQAAAVVVLIIAIVAVVCGFGAFTRTGKDNCIAGLAICGGLCLFSILLLTDQSANTRELPFNIKGMAQSIWMKTALVWALCYIGAAILTYLDNPPEANNSSANAPSDNAPKFSTSTVQPVISSSPSPQPQPQPQISKPKEFEPVLGVETPALIKRGKIFLSDDEFAEAERYFEQALRQDPENSQAYLGKLMAQLKVHNTDELSSVSSPLSEHKLFKRALEFAGDEEKFAVLECLEANKRHLEEQKVEREYQKALKSKKDVENGHNTEAMKRVLKTFEKLGSYKDSEALAESLRQHIAKEE